jgi:hypothetical protein
MVLYSLKFVISMLHPIWFMLKVVWKVQFLDNRNTLNTRGIHFFFFFALSLLVSGMCCLSGCVGSGAFMFLII